MGAAGMDQRRGITRRRALTSAGAAAVLLPLARRSDAAPSLDGLPVKALAPAGASPALVPPRKLLFFTAAEYALVDELSEIIIPTDDHSPGARAAGVAVEIDRRAGDRFAPDPETPRWQKNWRDGLARIEALSKEMHGASFLGSTPDQRLALMTRIAAGEKTPKTPEERFFRDLKNETARAYYSSEIGLHKEIEYKGNVSLNEFVGTDASTVPLKRNRGRGKSATGAGRARKTKPAAP